ncbi:MAG: dihydrofolate reductase family protein [Nocardioidaceae bacterium]
MMTAFASCAQLTSAWRRSGASTTPVGVWWAGVSSTAPADEVSRLKQQPGKDLVLFGGADIASTFMRLGLIDEYRLFVHPVALGGGTPLFPATDERVKLTLVEARTFDAAVVHLRYQKANETR